MILYSNHLFAVNVPLFDKCTPLWVVHASRRGLDNNGLGEPWVTPTLWHGVNSGTLLLYVQVFVFGGNLTKRHTYKNRMGL